MSASEEINAKLDKLQKTTDWCAAALLRLLQEKVDGLPEDEDAWLYDGPLDATERVGFDGQWPEGLPIPDPNEHLAVRTRPQPKAKACPHNQQGIVDGHLKCLRCGWDFTDTGSVQNRVGPNGQILRDPDPPGWALEHSPGASSKNPGTPLVPHEV